MASDRGKNISLVLLWSLVIILLWKQYGTSGNESQVMKAQIPESRQSVLEREQPVSMPSVKRRPAFSGDTALQKYVQEATRNITVWRRNLFGIAEKMNAKHLKYPNSVSAPKHFDIAPQIISCPPGMKLSLVGVDKADGGKWVCGFEALKAPCHILSLGSNGNYHFENDVLANTPCNIYTFDCTLENRGGGKTLHPTRHRFVSKCIGSREKAAQDSLFMSLPQAMEHVSVKKFDLFKIDIEGFEFDVLSTWGTEAESDLDTSYLPTQIVMEVHVQYYYFGTNAYRKDDLSNLLWPMTPRMSVPELALFNAHLSDLGYGVVFVEKNLGCAHCAEVVLYRVSELAERLSS
jgi:hypothetical protein